MRIAFLILCCFSIIKTNAQNSIGAIGTWREHYNNFNIQQVIKGDQYYIASKNQLIVYNETTGKIGFLGKSDGLHEIGIQTIAWDAQNEQLIIAYTNSAIDIVKGDQVYLINGIKNTSLFNNKEIKSIRISKGLGFVETGFGIVVIDLTLHEIKETWQNKDLTQAEKIYSLSSIPYLKNIEVIKDSIKGIAIAPDLSKWINISGPRKTMNGIASVNEQMILAPFANNTNGFATYTDQGWTNYFSIQNTTIPNIEWTAANPTSNLFWLANKQSIYSFDGNQLQLIQNNLVGSIKNISFSKNGRGWVLNDQKGLSYIQNNNTKTYSLSNGINLNGSIQLLANQNEQLYLTGPSIQGLYIFQSDNYYNTISWVQKTTGSNSGNLPSNRVTSMVEDRDGAIWVGTDNGIGIFNCGDISKEACNAYLPIVKTNGFNAYLFQKETIRCMAVDAANQKWIGTNNGAWLVSQDGLSIIEHFTKDNSPLPSDTIDQMIIEPNNGEVFFKTNQEWVSYRSTATKATTHQENIFIFPNPVPPDFSGLISFKKLVDHAQVKITDINGKLIYQTRALGGQAVWNGKTYEGSPVATGIYLVFVRDDEGNEKAVGKIMITKGY
ncbi:MAG: two-component regulator propeller domain-containing protein [Sediminibacterium sp.]